MINVLIHIYYIDNFLKKEILSFPYEVNEFTVFLDILPRVQCELQAFLSHPLCENKFYVKDHKSLIPINPSNTLLPLVADGHLNIAYLNIILPYSSGYIDKCKSHNNGNIYFSIFPREHNHRFLPHVSARSRPAGSRRCRTAPHLRPGCWWSGSCRRAWR